MNFSPRLLNAFLTLAHCRHFTLAATRVHMSQSAFSQAISRLEAQVGVRLFDRNTRSVTLTPEGDLLLPVAMRLMQGIGDIFQDLRDHADRKKGKLRSQDCQDPPPNGCRESLQTFSASILGSR